MCFVFTDSSLNSILVYVLLFDFYLAEINQSKTKFVFITIFGSGQKEIELVLFTYFQFQSEWCFFGSWVGKKAVFPFSLSFLLLFFRRLFTFFFVHLFLSFSSCPFKISSGLVPSSFCTVKFMGGSVLAIFCSKSPCSMCRASLLKSGNFFGGRPT